MGSGGLGIKDGGLAMSERQARFIKIISKEKHPTLYCPAAFVSLPVEPGQVYRATFTAEELANVVEAKLGEEVTTGFDFYYALHAGSPKTGGADFSWEKQRA